MKCPYCGGETETGVITSPHELSWIKGEKRPFFSRAEFHEGAVVLSGFSALKGSAVKAYLCRECRKVIIDYSDLHSDLNVK